MKRFLIQIVPPEQRRGGADDGGDHFEKVVLGIIVTAK